MNGYDITLSQRDRVRDDAVKLRALLRQVRRAKIDARDFALFELRDDLHALGIDKDDIDNFDATDDAALDHHIDRAHALATVLGAEDEEDCSWLLGEFGDSPEVVVTGRATAVIPERSGPHEPTEYMGLPAYLAQNFTHNAMVRRDYVGDVRKLDPFGNRSDYKGDVRNVTPQPWRAIVEAKWPDRARKQGSIGGNNRTNPKVDAFTRKLGRVGRGIGVLQGVAGAAEIIAADNRPRAASSVLGATGGGMVGGIAGGELGAAAGLLGGPFAPITVPVGAVVGGVAGSIGGGFYGHQAGEAAYDAAVQADRLWRSR